MSDTGLECRVVVRRHPGGRVDLGMYSPVDGRYAPLGMHGPEESVVDAAVRGLAERISREGHRLTFSDCAADRSWTNRDPRSGR